MDIAGPSIAEEVAPPRVQAMREKVSSAALIEKALADDPNASADDIVRTLERQLRRHVSAVWVARTMEQLRGGGRRMKDEEDAEHRTSNIEHPTSNGRPSR